MLKMRSKKKSKQIKLLAVVFFCMRFKQWESENTYRRIEWKTFFHFCSFSLCTATLYCPLPHWINPKKITICGSKTKQNLNDFQSKDIKQLWTWKMCCCLVVRIFIPKIKEFLSSWFSRIDWVIRKNFFKMNNSVDRQSMIMIIIWIKKTKLQGQQSIIIIRYLLLLFVIWTF